jgi:hypothetical protein
MQAAAAAMTMFLCAAVLADTPQSAQPSEWAVWTPKEVRFVYQGFTTHYSCDGLRDKVKSVLLKLGARKDLQVRESPCAGPVSGPNPFPGVSIKMHVLEPATGKGGGTAMPTVPARWQRVDLTSARDLLQDPGDCELLEQIKETLLPKFTTRNVEYSSTCVPHQLTSGTRLKAEVLVVEAPAKAAAAPPPRSP